jgi:hypothetical protein
MSSLDLSASDRRLWRGEQRSRWARHLYDLIAEHPPPHDDAFDAPDVELLRGSGFLRCEGNALARPEPGRHTGNRRQAALKQRHAGSGGCGRSERGAAPCPKPPLAKDAHRLWRRSFYSSLNSAL